MALSPTSSRGSSGTVTSVTATDSTITVAGTAVAPTIAVTPASLGGLAGWTTVIKASDESVASSAVLQNDDELFFTAVSGQLYEVELFILYGSPAGAGTPDLKEAFGEDATTRGVLLSLHLDQTDTPNLVQLPTNQTTTTGVGTAAANRAFSVRGSHLGAGGVFRFLWAQNTSGVNATIVRAGSMLRYQRVI